MAKLWPFLVMISLYGVCLSMPGDDSKEPWTTVVAESSAHEGTGEFEAKSMPSLDLSVGEPKVLQNSLDFGSILERVLHDVFGFVGVLDKDSLLATDAVDESWAKWIRNVHQHLPLIPIKYVEPQDTENPLDDAPSPLWDYIFARLLKGQRFVSVDNDDEESDEEGKEENAVTYTTIKFDPMGQLFRMMKNVAKSLTTSDSVMNWWERVMKDFKTYSVFNEEKSYASDKEDKDFGFGIFDYFNRGFTFGEHDLLKLAINSLIFVGLRSLFWRVYFPTEGRDDVGSFPDYLQDYEYGDEEEEDDYGYNEDEGDEDDYYGNDEDEGDEEGYGQYDDEGQEEEGYDQYDGGGDDGGQEEGYYQHNDDSQGEGESHNQYDDDDGFDEQYFNQGFHEVANQGGYPEAYQGGYPEAYQGGYPEANQGGYVEANQGFDQNVHQEVSDNANLGFVQSTYQGFGEGANQGFEQDSNQDTNEGFNDLLQSSYKSTDQGFPQSSEGLQQSSYLSYSEGLTEDGDTDIKRLATDWPRPSYHNLSPEFNHGRSTYRDSHSQRRDDTNPRGSNGLRWSDIYKNNSYKTQGSTTRGSYGQNHPHRYSYSYEQGNIYRNSYGQQHPNRNSYGYKQKGPRVRRPHAAMRSFSIFGKK